MFSLRTTSGTITIILADVIVCYIILGSALLLWSQFHAWLIPENIPLYVIFPALTISILISLSLTRLYSFMKFTCPVDLLNKIVPSFLLSFGCIATLGFFIPRLTLLSWRLFPLLSIIYICLYILRYYVFYNKPQNRERILILGATNQAREIIEEWRSKKFRGYDILGIITSVENQVGMDFHGVPILSHIFQIHAAVNENAADSLVVTLRERRGKLPVLDLLKFKVQNILIHEGTAFYEKVKRKVIIDEFLKPSWIIFEDGFFNSSFHRSVKRIQGLIISFVLLTIFSPILLLVAILIKLESPGPVFYQQERVGRNGRLFRLLKFRSMRKDAESKSRPVFTQENDPRVTRIGRIIRKVRLDEVPQFINIFKGDMDMVGPRPERPYFVKQLEELIPYYNVRHTARPGLTGWAQVNYPYGDSIEDAKEKLKYDLYYLKNSSWYMDLLIIFLTIKEVLSVRGR